MDDLTQLVENEVIDRLASVDGVADVEEYGDQRRSSASTSTVARLPAAD